MLEPNSKILYLNSLNLSLVIIASSSDEDGTVSSKSAKMILLYFFSKPPLQESYLHRVDPMNIRRQTEWTMLTSAISLFDNVVVS